MYSMVRAKKVLVACAACLLFFSLATPNTTDGQSVRSVVKGVSVGVAYTGAAVSNKEGNTTTTESGNGFAGEAGYGFEHLWLGLQGSVASIDFADIDGSYTLSGVGIAGRYTFRDNTKQARPYLEAGIVQRQISTDFVGSSTVTVKATSGGVSLGGGVAIFLSPRVAIDIGGQYGFGSFSNWKANGATVDMADWQATSFVLRLGGRFAIGN